MEARQSVDELSKPQGAFKTFAENHTEFMVEFAALTRDLMGDDPQSETFVAEQVAKLCHLQTKAQASRDAIQKVAPLDSYCRLGFSLAGDSTRARSGIQVRAQYGAASEEQRRTLQLDDLLKQSMDTEYENHPHRNNYQATACWAAWCRETGATVAQEQDEDLEVQKGGQYKNMRCTLTQKHIFELEDPVEDSHQYIWERRAILEHIRKQRAPVVNPAKPNVVITEAELKTCRRVQRDAARHRKEQESQAATEAVDVL
jgi:hypothetical protein